MFWKYTGKWNSEFIVEFQDKGINANLYKDLSYTLSDELCEKLKVDKGTTIVAPKGSWTNFASIPKVFWSIYPPTGTYAKGAGLHDFLCTEYYANLNIKEGYMHPNQNLTDVENWKSEVPKNILESWDNIDSIFYEAILTSGCSKWTSYIMYKSIKTYGYFRRIKNKLFRKK